MLLVHLSSDVPLIVMFRKLSRSTGKYNYRLMSKFYFELQLIKLDAPFF